MVFQTQVAWIQTRAPGLKILKSFNSMIGLQKQIFPHSSKIFHSYAVELNCKFFLFASYFINLLYSKRKE
jgi:hypothetical protein